MVVFCVICIRVIKPRLGFFCTRFVIRGPDYLEKEAIESSRGLLWSVVRKYVIVYGLIWTRDIKLRSGGSPRLMLLPLIFGRSSVDVAA